MQSDASQLLIYVSGGGFIQVGVQKNGTGGHQATEAGTVVADWFNFLLEPLALPLSDWTFHGFLAVIIAMLFNDVTAVGAAGCRGAMFGCKGLDCWSISVPCMVDIPASEVDMTGLQNNEKILSLPVDVPASWIASFSCWLSWNACDAVHSWNSSSVKHWKCVTPDWNAWWRILSVFKELTSPGLQNLDSG